MVKVVIVHNYPDENIEQQYLPENAVVEFKYSPTEELLIENCQDADGIISSSEPLTEKVIKGLRKCKIIAKESIGFDNIDIAAAAKRGIAVTNLPTYCVHEVADHTMALLLCLNRRIIPYHNNVQSKKWQYDLCSGMVRLANQTLGLYGFGHIAKLVARRALGFGLKVIVYDKFVDSGTINDWGVEFVDSDTLLALSDIVSVHLPLTKETQSYFNKAIFAKMKKSPIFINTSRGKVVNENDLADALDAGRISAAGLDVLPSEPDLSATRLLKRENVIVTPHMAFYSDTSMYDMRKLSALSITNYLRGNWGEINIVNGIVKT